MKKINMLLTFILFFVPTANYASTLGDSIQQIIVLPPDISVNANFGASVYISPNYIIVGAPNDNINDQTKGSAYIYSYQDTIISLMQKLSVNDGSIGDRFGTSVRIMNNFAFIGAPGRGEYGDNSGVVYVFQYQDSVWVQIQKLYASNPSENDNFGYSISGEEYRNWLVIGAPYKARNDTTMGACYLFIASNNNWIYENEIFPNDGKVNQRFGFSHDVLGNQIIVGSPGENSYGINTGSIYRYFYDDWSNQWEFVHKKFSTQPLAGDEFGFSIDIGSYVHLVIGAPGVDQNGINAGKAYLYGINGYGFGLIKGFQSSDIKPLDGFGSSVCMQGYDSWFHRIIVGTPNKLDYNNSGAAYLFSGDLYVVNQAFVLLPRSGSGGDKYGAQVSMCRSNWNYFLVSSPYNDLAGINSGAVYFNKLIHWDPVPVELTSFVASFLENKIVLNWTTATELNNRGFEIERSFDKNEWRIIGFREGKGTTSEPQEYFYSDDISDISSSKLYYRLKQIDFNGAFEYSDVVEVEITPLEFSLSQNFPNPFNPSTKISWQLPISSWVTLKIFDALGSEVETLVNEYQDSGNHSTFYPSGINSTLPSGIYFYQLKAGDYVETKKMLFLK